MPSTRQRRLPEIEKAAGGDDTVDDSVEPCRSSSSLVVSFVTSKFLLLRKIRVSFHFRDLLGVAFRVGGDQKNPLIRIQRTDYGMREEVVAQIVIGGLDVVHGRFPRFLEGFG